MSSLRKRIDKIPSGREWWRSDAVERMTKEGKKMLGKGFTVDEVVEILENIYSIVASEYGE